MLAPPRRTTVPTKDETAEVVAPDQPLTIDLGDARPRDARFQSHLRAPSGQPNGQQLFFAGKLRVSGDAMLIEVSIDFTELVQTDDGPVANFAGEGRHCTPTRRAVARRGGSWARSVQKLRPLIV